MYFDEKLKKLRVDKGLSLEELVRELNIPKSILEDLETGFRDPGEQDLAKISDFFNVRPEDIADDKPAINAFSVLFGAGGILPFVPAAQTFTDDQALLPGTIDIPFLNEAINHGGNQETVYEYPDKHIRAVKAPEGEYILLRVTDDSMRAFGILKGDAAIIRRQSEVEPGHVAAVQNKEGCVFLRLVRKDGREPVPEATDKDCLTPTLAQDDRIYGRVVEIRRNF
ncbi:MAG: helix-turn-helix domain-containing protein [Acidaminococcales bacterium]|jgi:transcriptional regulator with XRE-family HTH domain|nr:helix-turn-helix domain-containing protein [Acidaminococcales bacterium]